ncbi:MAG TPA: penicillin acylase family protein [Gemmatimonas sp.]|nr:penicillin acylase family protein [Gemmatimonas sp.]
MNRISPLLALVVLATPILPPSWLGAQAATRPTAKATAKATAQPAELARQKATASRVTIMRDGYGVPHVYGRTDADAVFGLIYAQAEDDFNRIEMNYINAMGRLAEVEGEAELYRDLRMKLFIDPPEIKRLYAASPAWLKAIMNGWADGLNYYLATHPAVKPRLLTRFEPWMALTFSEGSIGGDIATVNVRALEALYGKPSGAGSPGSSGQDIEAQLEAEAIGATPPEPGGSNGFAIAPANTVNGHSLLLINPHTSFYFRPEVHVVSEEGLNAYGAVTWGQFFIYQGFNSRVGWMHTSGGGDVIDEYLLTVVERNGKRYYKYGTGERALVERRIVLPYKQGNGTGSRTVTAYFSHHGPVVRESNGKWVAVKMMNEPLKALTQSYQRTKATSYATFVKTMDIRTNSSNNTVYADADGNIAYFHGNFIPIRDPKIDFTVPVDGSSTATEWKGLHTVKETINLFNPKSGWLQNTNNSPWASSGESSPKESAFPKYMQGQTENARGLHAVRVLQGKKDFTLDRLIAAAYDSYLTAFEPWIPALVLSYDALPQGDPMRASVGEQVAMLRAWDLRFSVSSVPTALAIYWAQDMLERSGAAARAKGMSTADYIGSGATPAERLSSLQRASQKLERDFGTWKTPWGEINRFQRITGDIVQPFDDSKPSLPVAFTSSNWGSLASFGTTQRGNTKRMYGESGNSFVAVVEFGPRVKARTLLAGGVNGDPTSPHFIDQADRYVKGDFKDALYYRADVEKGAKRRYHPGQ